MRRNVMRPVNELGDFTIATDVKDGEVRVVVQALKKDTGENLNFLNMSATGSDPKMGTVNFSMQQEAPGRYVGKFKADQSGSYLLAISPGKGFAPLLTGASVPAMSVLRTPRFVRCEPWMLVAEAGPLVRATAPTD